MGVVDKAGGPLRFTVYLVVAVVVLAAALAGTLWAVDYGVEATVVDKNCALAENTVQVQESVTRIKHTEPIAAEECTLVQEGNFAIYSVRSGRLQIFDREDGNKLWDSQWLANVGLPGLY